MLTCIITLPDSPRPVIISKNPGYRALISLDRMNSVFFSFNKYKHVTASQPLMLLLAAAVYDLPTGTVPLCLAVDSARTAVRRSTMPARQSGTRCLMNLDILTVLIVLKGTAAIARGRYS